MQDAASGNRDAPWYHSQPEEFGLDMRELLEKYSHIPVASVDAHVLDLREKAWAIYGAYLKETPDLQCPVEATADTTAEYPCIGMFRFLNLSISTHPAYPRVLSALQASESDSSLLDLGCCFAQDIRKLIYDGVPSGRLYGTDLHLEFLELGYELFADRETCAAHFFAADVFQDGKEWDRVRGKLDIIHAGSFFHLFGWDDQVKICKRVIGLLKPQKGSMVFGRQVGNLTDQEVRNAASGDRGASRVWRHNAESFKKLWVAAGQETGTRWKTWAELDTGEGMSPGHWSEPGIRRLRFQVERLE